MTNGHPTWTLGQKLSNDPVFGTDPAKVVADYFSSAKTAYASVDDRELVDKHTGKPVILDGVYSRKDADLTVFNARHKAEQAIQQTFEDARNKVRASVSAKALPPGLKEQVEIAREMEYGPQDIIAMQQQPGIAGNYNALRYIEKNLVKDDATFGVPLQTRPVADLIEEINNTERMALNAVRTDPAKAEHDYRVQVVAKGEVTKSTLTEAEFFAETFGGDK